MGFLLEELRPCAITVKLGDKHLKIKALTLELEVEVIARWQSINNMFDYIQKNPIALYEIFKFFCVDEINIRDLIKNDLRSADEIDQLLYYTILKSVQNSMPIIKNIERYEEFKKVNNLANEKKVCYGEYYDTIASRYKYTIEDFYNLTLRQLHILLNTINDKKYDELEVQAALMGRELKPRMKMLEVDEKTDKEQMNEANEIVERLKKNKAAINGK